MNYMQNIQAHKTIYYSIIEQLKFKLEKWFYNLNNLTNNNNCVCMRITDAFSNATLTTIKKNNLKQNYNQLNNLFQF